MENLNPLEIYNRYQHNEIDSLSLINSLMVVIEESDDQNLRVKSIEFLEKVAPNNLVLFKLIENCAVSDISPLVRIAAIKTLISTFPSECANPIMWSIQNENSILVIKTLKDILTNCYKAQFYALKDRIDRNLSTIYGVVTEEAIFLLELHAMLWDKNPILMRTDVNSYTIESDFSYVSYTIKNDRIVTLNLNLFDITEIPQSIERLKNLETLEVSGSNFKGIDTLIWTINPLHSGFYALKKIEKLPDVIKKLSSLRTLYLNRLDIDEIPNSIAELSLKNLTITNCNIQIIPDFLWSLESLESLDLSRNKIVRLPENISALKNLKALNLEGNKFEIIPQSLRKMDNLQHLFIELRKVRDIPELVLKIEFS